MLNQGAVEAIAELPHGIHSGLRRENCYGMFFYFQAPRTAGEGKRHFWRYIDARTHEIEDNRYAIAQRIACQRDEPRYIGDQDVFVLQEKVIAHILSSECEAEAKAAAPPTVDPIQQVVSEELKDALRRQSLDRNLAKETIRFLSQPMGRALHKKLKESHQAWSADRDDMQLLEVVSALAAEFSKDRPISDQVHGVQRGALTLICFESVTA